MPHRFCAICGKDLDKYAPHYSMCINCYLKEHPLFELPPNFSFNLCADCGNYAKSEEWYESDSEDLFLTIFEVLEKYVLKKYLKNDAIVFNYVIDDNSIEYSSNNNLKEVSLNVIGTLKEDNSYSSEQSIRILINYDLCKNCSNLRSGIYFLSILQLRVKSEEYFDIINKAFNEINQYVETIFLNNKKQYISKVEDQKYGIDLYLSTNELMNKIIGYLGSRFHFILIRSKKLVGRDNQRGKNLYRLKSVVKFLPLKKNDVIFINNQEFIVENILKRTVILRDKRNNKSNMSYTYFYEHEFHKKD
jgi:nonsense-mediated mRNA decay protein 3